jgi:hypothetical protein
MPKTVEVTLESDSGRNQRFHDDRTGRDMSRQEFVQRIQQGDYPDYHVRIINHIATPTSNPDGSESNNLG